MRENFNVNKYYFDFNGFIEEKLPLTQRILKVCKYKISKIADSGDKQLDLNNKISITWADVVDTYFKEQNCNEKNFNDLNNMGYFQLNFFYLKNIYSDLKYDFILYKDKINYLIERKLGFVRSNLNKNAYCFINDQLYVSYKNSYILADLNFLEIDLNNFKKDKKINPLFKNSIIETYYNVSIFNLVDTLIIKFILYIHLLYLKAQKKNRLDFRLKQTSWGFYNDIYNNNQNFFIGLNFLWKCFKVWLVSLLIGLSAVYYLMYIRLLPFNKIIFSWILICMFVYWLLSGFVFFVKKYQFGRFTSVIQRFWKRTYILFWIIEVGTFSVFFYLTLNASAEPIYMYDQIRVYKSHLFSWRYFLLKLIPSTLIILLGYYLLLSLKWNIFNKQNTTILLITLLLLYILWLEFYQFFHIISFFGNINWSFDYDEYIWSLDIDSRRTRLANNYIAVCLLLKFWHFIFIFLFWVFFVLRVNELGRVRYPLLVANIQNFIIIYMMSWVYMYPWFKFVFRKYLDVPYYWFYLNGRDLGSRVFFTDLKLFYYGISDRLFFNLFDFKVQRYPFFYWINSSPLTSYDQYRNSIIRDCIITTFNSYII